jgi:hypothetical protein
MTNTTDQFLAKLEAFADTLNTDEQAILGHLLSDDDAVSGFAYTRSPWAVVSRPIPFANLRPKIDAFVSPQASATMSGETAKGEI